MDVIVQSHTPAALLSGKQLLIPLYRRLGGPQSWSEHYGEEWNLLPLPGIKPQLLSHPSCSLVTIVTELSQLLKLVHISNKFWTVYVQLQGMWCVWFQVGHLNLMQYSFSLSTLWSMIATLYVLPVLILKNYAFFPQNVFFMNCYDSESYAAIIYLNSIN
jgi:hypothetical protein